MRQSVTLISALKLEGGEMGRKMNVVTDKASKKEILESNMFSKLFFWRRSRENYNLSK